MDREELKQLRDELIIDLERWKALAQDAPPREEFRRRGSTPYTYSRVDEREAQIKAIDDLLDKGHTDVDPSKHPWW